MGKLNIKTDINGCYQVEIVDDEGQVVYTTDLFPSNEQAVRKAEEWIHWFNNAPLGKAESIYYILHVPEKWIGPPPNVHPYSGLHFKIGRTKDVDKRVQNLRTGTSGQLIIHALEPGDSKLERELHKRFQADRRQGEWFISSPELCEHVMRVWERNRLLPPEHQRAILELHERIKINRSIREVFGGAPDMVNPSLNERWYGKVFVDLVYSPIVRNPRNRR